MEHPTLVTSVSKQTLDKRTDVIENNVFGISYNETLEQPNWVEYEVRDIVKLR